MQERRTTIRSDHRCRAQYCASDDLLPRDGRLLNLSERGAGLLTREAHRSGEQITLNFSLHEAEDSLTATGVVRWSDESRRGHWHPLGLEWFPLEETTRNRLQTFLTDSTKVSPRAFPDTPRRILPRLILIILFGVGCLIGVRAYRVVRSLQQEKAQLQVQIQQRNLVIARLEEESKKLQHELEAAQLRIEATTQEVARLDQQVQSLEGQAQRLGGDVERFQELYVRLREEREQLIQQVLTLEQERALLAHRLSSLSELRLAVREAIDARKQAIQAQHRLTAWARHMVDSSLNGNRGYLIREGHPTGAPATMWIRVHEPEALSPRQ